MADTHDTRDGAGLSTGDRDQALFVQSREGLQDGHEILTFFNGETDERGVYVEEAVIWGSVRDTPELHNVRCGDRGDCECIADRKWCFLPTQLTVATPNARWVFIPEAPVQIECVRDNQGSCAWNALGASDRFFVTLRNPTEIHARALTNSRSIGIRIGCRARYYP